MTIMIPWPGGKLELTGQGVKEALEANNALMYTLALVLAPGCFNNCGDLTNDEVINNIKLARAEVAASFAVDFLEQHNIIGKLDKLVESQRW